MLVYTVMKSCFGIDMELGNNLGCDENTVTLLIKWPGLEGYSGRILAYVELENQESTDDLEP